MRDQFFLHCNLVTMMKLRAGDADPKHFLRQTFHRDDAVAEFSEETGHIGQRDYSSEPPIAGHCFDLFYHITPVAGAVPFGHHRKASDFAKIFGKDLKRAAADDLALVFANDEAGQAIFNFTLWSGQQPTITRIISE